MPFGLTTLNSFSLDGFSSDKLPVDGKRLTNTPVRQRGLC